MPPLENWLFFIGMVAAAVSVPFVATYLVDRTSAPQHRIFFGRPRR